jgi:hypothetical protein
MGSTTKENGKVAVGSRLYWKQLMYYTKAARSLASLVSLYCIVFHPDPFTENPPKKNLQKTPLTMLIASPGLAYAILLLFPQTTYR